jgi:putative membrane-bound dehydrogenase-like protein
MKRLLLLGLLRWTIEPGWLSFAAELPLHPVAAPDNCSLHPALEISLFAREPDVIDPVALTFDGEGRMFVVEMRDYPYGFGPDRRPGGAIRLIEDTDGDGRADRSGVFAEGLSFPTSIAAWNGGVLVTAPPEVLFLQDRDGDGKAEVREVLFKGFVLGVTDSNMSGLRWGLDNRVHGINGGNGGTVISSRRPGPGVVLHELDFSFDPASGDLKTTYQTGGGFGLVFDAWGRSFVTHNINHMQHRIMPVRYLNRFQGVPPVDGTHSISDHGEMAQIYPVSEPTTRVNHPEQSGHFSSSGGLGYLGWNGYPSDLPGSLFVCDVVGNIVHRDVLQADGPIFVARRSPQEQAREFFGSRDPAFRPTGIELGPDGALYLIDMQRDVIEHPDYIPQKVREKLDIRAGDQRGRIYRVTPRGGLPASKPRLSGQTGLQLVGHLRDSNQWWRSTAQRLLVERGDRSIVPALQELARSRDPFGQLHALWTLQGLGALSESLVIQALRSPQPGLRENALLLAETLLPGSTQLQQTVLGLADDTDTRVRFQAALTFGQLESTSVHPALRRIFLADYPHRWSRIAVLSSLKDGERAFLRDLLEATAFLQSSNAPKRLDAVRELSDLCGARMGARSGDALAEFLQIISAARVTPGLQVAALEGVQRGLSRTSPPGSSDPRIVGALEKFSRPESPALFAAAWKLGRTVGLPESEIQREALSRASQDALNAARSVEQRQADVQVVALGSYTAAGRTLVALLESGQPPALREAALAVLRQYSDLQLPRDLVEHWRVLAPAARPTVVNLFLQRVAFHDVLMSAIEQDRIKLGELNLDLEQRRRLLRKSSPEIKARAAKFIGDEEYSNRKTVVEDWLRKLPATGDSSRGRLVFDRLCAQCHALNGVGNQVGPDLGASAHRGVEDLLSNILDPNMAINPNYISFTAETTSGEIETGLLKSETADAVVLLQAMNKEVTLPRRQLKRLESSGVSLMPEGLEAGLTPADLRDLIAFLQSRR